MAFLIDRICPAVTTRLAAVPDRVSAFSSNAATSSVVAVSNAKDATSVVPVPAAPLFCPETVTGAGAEQVVSERHVWVSLLPLEAGGGEPPQGPWGGSCSVVLLRAALEAAVVEHRQAPDVADLVGDRVGGEHRPDRRGGLTPQ